MVQLFFTYSKTICHRFLCHIDPGNIHFKDKKNSCKMLIEQPYGGLSLKCLVFWFVRSRLRRTQTENGIDVQVTVQREHS